ncbi:MAG: ATP-binding protein, partial [Anaerolineae bacterium]|nr:ATP-binding protein [Anaerolineae bacterium]
NDIDGYEQTLQQVVSDAIGAEFSPYHHVAFDTFQDRTVCIVRVEPSPKPVYLTDRGSKDFYVRVGNTTRPLNMQAAHDYISMHWPT